MLIEAGTEKKNLKVKEINQHFKSFSGVGGGYLGNLHVCIWARLPVSEDGEGVALTDPSDPMGHIENQMRGNIG